MNSNHCPVCGEPPFFLSMDYVACKKCNIIRGWKYEEETWDLSKTYTFGYVGYRIEITVDSKLPDDK